MIKNPKVGQKVYGYRGLNPELVHITGLDDSTRYAFTEVWASGATWRVGFDYKDLYISKKILLKEIQRREQHALQEVKRGYKKHRAALKKLKGL